MNKKDIIILTLGMSTLAVACVFMYLWYNKDRYQFIHYQQGIGSLGKVDVKKVIFDKNKGVEYIPGYRVDHPNAKTFERHGKVLEE